MKIIQILFPPPGTVHGACLFGLGDDGAVYIEYYQNGLSAWQLYIPPADITGTTP